MASEQFCLKWNDHKGVLTNNVDRLLHQKSFVDCTLAAEGQFVGAHKVILSACSPYFEALLSHHTEKHPIFILKDIKFEEVKAIMSYMYRGEVIVPYDKLAELLRAAESLQVKGLGEKNCNKNSELNGSPQQQLQQYQLQQQKTPVRPIVQTSTRVRSGGSGDRRVTQPNAEVVDLTDEPLRTPKLPKSVVIQRTSPYSPQKYARKLDYQSASQRVIQRNDSVSMSDPNSSGVFLPQNPGLVVRSSVSGPSASTSQHHVPPPGQYAASNVSPTVNRQRISAQQGALYQQISSLGPAVQVTASSSHNIVHQQKSSSNVSGVPNRAPIIAQNLQAISSQASVSSENEQSQGQFLSSQSSQLPSVQKIHLPCVPSPKLHMVSGSPSQSQLSPGQPSQSQLSPGQPSQSQLSPGQPSQVQMPLVNSPQTQSLQKESPQVQSSSELPLVQRTSDTYTTSDTVTEPQEKSSLSLESSMVTEDSSQSAEFDSLTDSAQPPEEESNKALDSPEERDEENPTITDSPSNEQKITKARRGRPVGVDRPFKCPECGKLFAQKSNMEKHRRIHSGECLKCDICDKSFVGRSTLIRHLRTHNTKNNHKCQICGMMFSSTKVLEDHLTQHASTSSSDQ